MKKANVNLNRQSSESQNAQIAAWLEQGYTLTQLEALRLFGCMRLPSRIFDLRERGYNIIVEKICVNDKWVAQYHLAK